MRNLKSLALTAILALTSAAFAVTSTPTTYNTATASTTASGEFGQTVEFTIPSASISIDAVQLKPGETYTITIPVTNSTSNRTMTVTSTPTLSGTLPANLYTLTADTESLTDLAAGSNGNIVYTLVVNASASATDFADQTLTFTFDLTATGTN